MKHFQVKNFGPLEAVDLQFGDLTIVVGAQASGKSLCLELLKLIVDRNHIINTLDRYNYIWGHNTEKILDVFFGEGMNGIWTDETRATLDETPFLRTHIPKKAEDKDETLFYIPAQRILSISDGRPKNFMEFDNSSPYILRSFSETLRLFMQNGMGKGDTVFPLKNRLKGFLRHSFNQSIFHDGKIVMVEMAGQKKLRMNIDRLNIPFMSWSAGQKEFMPLLLAFYCLSGPPSKVVKRDKYKYVVLEEPEMGLHPQAIVSIILQIIELMQSGYKIILSTHSPVLLEFAWAYNILQAEQNADRYKALHRIFGIREDTSVSNMMNGLLEHKSIRTYYFCRQPNGKVVSQDISTLDVENIDENIAEWGGISEFSSKVSDIISQYIAFSHE